MNNNLADLDDELNGDWVELTAIKDLEAVQQVMLRELEKNYGTALREELQRSITLATALIEVHERNLEELQLS